MLVLLSGDKGGSMTKLLLQIINTKFSQSVRQAKVIAIFDGEQDNRECIEHVSSKHRQYFRKILLF